MNVLKVFAFLVLAVFAVNGDAATNCEDTASCDACKGDCHFCGIEKIYTCSEKKCADVKLGEKSLADATCSKDTPLNFFPSFTTKEECEAQTNRLCFPPEGAKTGVCVAAKDCAAVGLEEEAQSFAKVLAPGVRATETKTSTSSTSSTKKDKTSTSSTKTEKTSTSSTKTEKTSTSSTKTEKTSTSSTGGLTDASEDTQANGGSDNTNTDDTQASDKPTVADDATDDAAILTVGGALIAMALASQV